MSYKDKIIRDKVNQLLRNNGRSYLQCYSTDLGFDHGVSILNKIKSIDSQYPKVATILVNKLSEYIRREDKGLLRVMYDLLETGRVNELLYTIYFNAGKDDKEQATKLKIMSNLDDLSLKQPMESYFAYFGGDTRQEQDSAFTPFFESFLEKSNGKLDGNVMFKRFQFMLPNQVQDWTSEQKKQISELALFTQPEEVVFLALKSLKGELERRIGHRFDWVLDYLSSHILLKGAKVNWYKTMLSKEVRIHYQPPPIDMSEYIDKSLYDELNQLYEPAELNSESGLIVIKFEKLESKGLKSLLNMIQTQVGLEVSSIGLKNEEVRSRSSLKDIDVMHADYMTVCTLSFPYHFDSKESSVATEYITFNKKRANGLPVDSVYLQRGRKRFHDDEEERKFFVGNISYKKAGNFELNINVREHTFHSTPRSPGVQRWFIAVFFKQPLW